MATTPDAATLADWYSEYQKMTPGATTPAALPAASSLPAAMPAGAPSPAAPASTGMLGIPKATTTQWTPDAKSTVAGQLKSITEAGSPLLDQAETSAKQQMNARGLLNSSIAITAGQDALYRTALPIAQQDAQTFGRADEFNANAANTTSQFNTGVARDVAMQQAGFGQQTAERVAGQEFAGSQADLDRTQQLRVQQLQEQGMDARQAQTIAAQERSQASQQTFQAEQQSLQNTFAAGQQVSQQEFQARQQALTEAGVTNRFDRELAQRSEQFNVEQAAADRRLTTQHANELERMGFANDLNKANVPSAFAAQVSSETAAAVNAILADPNISPEDKKGAIQNAVDYANSRLSWASTFYNTAFPSITAPAGAVQPVGPRSDAAPATPTAPFDEFNGIQPGWAFNP